MAAGAMAAGVSNAIVDKAPVNAVVRSQDAIEYRGEDRGIVGLAMDILSSCASNSGAARATPRSGTTRPPRPDPKRTKASRRDAINKTQPT
jgi:hypothetical protein